MKTSLGNQKSGNKQQTDLKVRQYVDAHYLHVLYEYQLVYVYPLGSRSKRMFSLGFLL